MYLGETIEEKRESYELLTKKSKKLAKIFGVIGGIIGVILGLCLMFAADGNKAMIAVSSLFIMVIVPVFYYWYGYLLYYCFVTVKSWFAKLGIGVSGVAVAAGESIAISYLLGGRKSAKVAGIVWLIALAITISFGFYVGAYKYLKVRSEAKQLGFI